MPKVVISTVPNTATNQFKTPTIPANWMDNSVKPQIKEYQPRIDSFMKHQASTLPKNGDVQNKEFTRTLCDSSTIKSKRNESVIMSQRTDSIAYTDYMA